MDARITDRAMTGMLNARFQTSIGRTTVLKIRNERKILYRPPITVQHLTEDQMTASLNWARWMLGEFQKAEAAKMPLVIIFSDESRFCQTSDCRWVRFRRGQWNHTALYQARKFAQGLMVWGRSDQHGIATGALLEDGQRGRVSVYHRAIGDRREVRCDVRPARLVADAGRGPCAPGPHNDDGSLSSHADSIGMTRTGATSIPWR